MIPFFSVVIPLYNKEDYIKDTLKSVLNQTFTDFEIIIVDDGSTDNSFKIVEKIKDSRIHIYSNKNNGLSYSRNYGIKKAKASYIAFIDADDLWMEDFLETIYKLINSQEAHLIFATNVELFPPNKIPNLDSNTFDIRFKKTITNYFKLCKNILSFSSLVVNKSVFETVGYFDESVNYGEEDDFYIRCFSSLDFIYYNKPKAYYRVGIKNQLTAPNKNFERKIPNYERYLKNNGPLELKKFLDFIHYNLVVLFKMEKNHQLVKFYKQKINVSNLTSIQKIKYYLPTNLFYITKRVYIWLSKRLIHS